MWTPPAPNKLNEQTSKAYWTKSLQWQSGLESLFSLLLNSSWCFYVLPMLNTRKVLARIVVWICLERCGWFCIYADFPRALYIVPWLLLLAVACSVGQHIIVINFCFLAVRSCHKHIFVHLLPFIHEMTPKTYFLCFLLLLVYGFPLCSNKILGEFS